MKKIVHILFLLLLVAYNVGGTVVFAQHQSHASTTKKSLSSQAFLKKSIDLGLENFYINEIVEEDYHVQGDESFVGNYINFNFQAKSFFDKFLILLPQTSKISKYLFLINCVWLI